MRKSKGFTLIELMVVVAIVAIIASIAIPTYNEQVRKSRRADAARFVGDLQLRLEQWRAENPSYANCGASCTSGTYPTLPAAGTSPYYTIAIPAADATTYTVTATPAGAQTGDRCGVLTATRDTKATWATASCN